jgi:hypothetical protein
MSDYTRSQTIDNNPNTGLPFETNTSFESGLFDSVSAHGGGEMGVGAFKQRSIDEALVEYDPANTAVNTFLMLFADRKAVDNVVHEWGEDDSMFPIDAAGVSEPADTTINNSNSDGDEYVAATSGNFIVSADDANIFRVNFKVRYASTSSGWQYAAVTAIEEVSGEPTKMAIVLKSITGDNLPVAGPTAAIQTLEPAYGSDLNYDPQPMSNTPSMNYTFLQKMATFGKWTERSQNEANMFDQAVRAQNKALKDMNDRLETHALYGVRGKYQLSNGDWVYHSPGLYDTAKSQNYHTASLKTGGAFDANKFKDTLYTYIQYNMGAESGGPKFRPTFIDGTMSNYLDRAFEDKQRFMSNDFVGGVKVDRFDIKDGGLDFVRTPQFELRHPIVGASLRQNGTPKGVMLTVPIAETVTRLEFVNEGLRSDIFRQQGGDEEIFYRVRYTSGMMHKLRQYSAVFEEVDE